MPDRTQPPSVAERARKSKWKRAQQVCTNCRQMKLRCDFQDRFPNPCTRCAAMGEARTLPCHVDPSFRRSVKRKQSSAERESPPSNGVASSSTAGSSPSAAGQAGSTNAAPTAPPVPLVPQRLTDPIPANAALPTLPTVPRFIVPPSRDGTSHNAAQGAASTTASNSEPGIPAAIAKLAHFPLPRTLGNVFLSSNEIGVFFEEFYTRFHPFVPVMTRDMLPNELYELSVHLFWTVCTIGARPRLDHPAPRARSFELCAELGREVRYLFSQLLMVPTRSWRIVQALVLLCEFPFANMNRGGSLVWMYSGMAVHLGTEVGMHRIFHSDEFGLDSFQEPMEVSELRERALTWVQVFVTHQSICSMYGYPSRMSEDWMLSRAQHKPVDMMRQVTPHVHVFYHLRIQRFTFRLARALGDNTDSKTGQTERAGRRTLRAVFAAELSDLQNALPHAVHSFVSVALLEAKIALYAFELQDEVDHIDPEAILACYSAAIRIITILAEANGEMKTRVTFWPRSATKGFTIALLVLLKLACLQAAVPGKFSIDRSVVLRECTVAVDIMKSRSLFAGDAADRTSQGIQFLCRTLADGGVPDRTLYGPVIQIKARMSLGGIFYDAIRSMKRAGRLPSPPPELPFVPAAAVASPIVPAALTPTSLSGLSPPGGAGTDAPPASAPVASGMVAPLAPVPVAEPLEMPLGAQLLQQAAAPAGLDGVLEFNAMLSSLGEPAPGDVSLPPFDPAGWMQLLSQEDCGEMMSAPGLGAFGTAWDVPDFLMFDGTGAAPQV